MFVQFGVTIEFTYNERQIGGACHRPAQTNKQVLYEVQEGNNINPINPPLGNDIIAHCDNFNSLLFPMNFRVI